VARLLLIEDDPQIRLLLIKALRERGHAVAYAVTAMTGLQAVLDDRPDLIILDLGLPDVDGLELLKMIRAVAATPVIVATARDGEPDVIKGLDVGADDYVVKPFTAAQLDARVRAVLRRSTAAPSTGETVVGGLRLDAKARTATLDGTALDLTPREFDLLLYLAQRTGEVVSKRDLLTDVWQVPYGGADKTVDVHLSWLRRKLGETALEPRYLHTVRGVGVRLSPPAGPPDVGPGSPPNTA
jgi:DNA-binding response OmpR family regulator